YDANNRIALQSLLQGGTQLVAYSDEIMQAAHKAAFEIYEENASKDATFKEIYDSWKKFRKQVVQWNTINDLSYANFLVKIV
ncbi:MAG TPA: ABC transporter substrate-binding protein, partial [Cyanothece sp. UBA12306]|nr:ABC transporter substrate-binding protein [Cyanothece sp. UBA12306]